MAVPALFLERVVPYLKTPRGAALIGPSESLLVADLAPLVVVALCRVAVVTFFMPFWRTRRIIRPVVSAHRSVLSSVFPQTAGVTVVGRAMPGGAESTQTPFTYVGIRGVSVIGWHPGVPPALITGVVSSPPVGLVLSVVRVVRVVAKSVVIVAHLRKGG